MATWNHRVIRKRDAHCEDEFYYEIHEAHYNDNGELCAITETPITPYGDDIEGLKCTLERMVKACEKPILIDGEIEYSPWPAAVDV